MATDRVKYEEYGHHPCDYCDWTCGTYRCRFDRHRSKCQETPNHTCPGLEQAKEKGVKTFFLWLVIQCVFARVMIGMTVGLWASLKVGPEYLFMFVGPATVICLAEAITSAIVVYPLINPNRR